MLKILLITLLCIFLGTIIFFVPKNYLKKTQPITLESKSNLGDTLNGCTNSNTTFCSNFIKSQKSTFPLCSLNEANRRKEYNSAKNKLVSDTEGGCVCGGNGHLDENMNCVCTGGFSKSSNCTLCDSGFTSTGKIKVKAGDGVEIENDKNCIPTPITCPNTSTSIVWDKKYHTLSKCDKDNSPTCLDPSGKPTTDPNTWWKNLRGYCQNNTAMCGLIQNIPGNEKYGKINPDLNKCSLCIRDGNMITNGVSNFNEKTCIAEGIGGTFGCCSGNCYKDSDNNNWCGEILPDQTSGDCWAPGTACLFCGGCCTGAGTLQCAYYGDT